MKKKMGGGKKPPMKGNGKSGPMMPMPPKKMPMGKMGKC